MSYTEILELALKKAQGNGFNLGKFMVKMENRELPLMPWPYECVVYDKEFAKAFWGEGDVNDEMIEQQNLWDDTYINEKWLQFSGPAWKFHLQQMVVADDPLRYLEKYLLL